jgi:DNA polymerase V
MVWDIVSSDAVQTLLFDEVDRGKQKKLIQAVDSINRKNGHNVVKVATMGERREYVADHKYVSRRYTTNINDILELKV